MSKQREPGYYWIRIDTGKEFFIAQLEDDGEWWFGYTPISTERIAEIDERPIKRKHLDLIEKMKAINEENISYVSSPKKP